MTSSLFSPARFIPAIAIGSLSLVIAACGGGSGDDKPASTTSAAYAGPITGLGSIVVNGVRFETVGVDVEDSDDLYGTTQFRSALALGMTVSLGGRVNESTLTGRPSRIRVLGGVRGFLASTPGAGATALATASGQSVVVDVNTIFAGATTRGAVSTSADLLGGDPVEIYGVTQGNGDFLATRVVALQAIPTTYQLAIRGTIVSSPSTSPATSQYVIQTSSTTRVTVDCINACELTPAGTTVGVNTPVRVLAVDASSLSNNVLTAAKIQSLSPTDITRFTGLTTSYAKIKGYTRQIGSDWYVGGVLVTGYAFSSAGQFVEVKGTWSGNTLQVARVELESDRRASGGAYRNEFYGVVSGKSGNTFWVQGIQIDASQAVFQGSSLSQLADGQYVEVKGSLSDGVLQAVQVEVRSAASGGHDDSDDHGSVAGHFEVYGTVSNWNGLANTFTLTSRRGVFTALAASAIVEHGQLPGDASVIEAKGYMDANQRFVITKLELKEAGFSDD